MLRLNLAIPPATSPQNTGLLGSDVAGFPNGRRVFDDVVTIESARLAGACCGWSTRRSPPTAPAGGINQGLTSGPATWPPWARRTTCSPSPTSACPTAASHPGQLT